MQQLIINLVSGLLGGNAAGGWLGILRSVTLPQDAWVQFAKTGNPGWDAYTTSERKTMLITKLGNCKPTHMLK